MNHKPYHRLHDVKNINIIYYIRISKICISPLQLLFIDLHLLKY